MSGQASGQMIDKDLASQLREATVGVVLRISNVGGWRKLSADQKHKTAETFEASERAVRGGRRIFKTDHPAWRKITSVIGLARVLWKDATVPYPEDGVRVINRERVQEFNRSMEGVIDQLSNAVAAIDAVYHAEVVPQSKADLGKLADGVVYPDTLVGEWAIDWEFRQMEPPDYLKRLSPKIWEAQNARIQARFDEAVGLLEDELSSRFAELVANLVEQLTPRPDGERKKKFYVSNIVNLQEWFDRFRALNLHSNAELDALVDQAKAALEGRDPASVKKNASEQSDLRSEFAAIKVVLDKMMIDAGQREIDLDENEETNQNEEDQS